MGTALPAQAARLLPGRDAAADRRGRDRAPPDDRPRRDDDQPDRRASGSAASRSTGISPTELTLARACSGLYFERRPPPNHHAWPSIADPEERLSVALGDVYAYHALTEADDDPRPRRRSRPPGDGALPTGTGRRPRHTSARAGAVRGRRRATSRAGIAVALSFDMWPNTRRRNRARRMLDARSRGARARRRLHAQARSEDDLAAEEGGDGDRIVDQLGHLRQRRQERTADGANGRRGSRTRDHAAVLVAANQAPKP